MAVKLGIANLQNAVGLAIQLGMQVDSVTANGRKFTFADSLSFLPELMQVPGIIKNAAAIKAEVADLDEEETKQLNAYVQTTFHVTNAHTDALIKKALDVIEQIFELINLMRNAKS